MAKQPESKLQRRIRAALEAAYPQSVWFKYHGGPFTKAGVPDLIGVVDGRMCALEVKRPGKEASPVQRRTIARLRRAGAITGVVTSRAEALELVDANLSPCLAAHYDGTTGWHCSRRLGHEGKCQP